MNDSKTRKVMFELLQRHGFWAMVSALLAMGLVVSGVLAVSPVQAEPMSRSATVVDIALAPCPKTVQVGKAFTLNIYVHPNGQQVDAVDADLTFDPTYLEVLSITGDPSALPDELFSDFDNLAGTVTHSRGIWVGTPPNSTFRLCSIEFKAKAATPGTTVAFTERTGAYFEGARVFRSAADCEVTVVVPVGGVGYLFDPGQILAPWVSGMVIAALILGAVVVFRKAH